MLYYPLVKEIDMKEARNLYGEMYKGKRKVDIVKSQVMEYLQGVEEARYHEEMLENEIDYSETARKLDPEGELENEESEELELEESEYEHLNPDDLSLSSENQTSSGLYKRIKIPGDRDLRRETRKLDVHQREVLDIVVKYAKDIVKSRHNSNKVPDPPFMMMHGGAGSGKSTVIRLIAQWAQKILIQDGQDVDCPCVVITAFCGTAAANVDGQTLHSSFGFSFNNDHNSLPDRSRDKRRAILRHLKLVIIDEISMVKADMLLQLDLRLQEIKERVGVPFGGVGVLVFGDLMQLPPCMGRYVFDEPANENFLITHKINPRWRMFKAIILEENHRQGEDKSFADLLNRLRIKEYTDEDLKTLKKRVRPKNHQDIKTAGLYITAKREPCDKINMKYISGLEGSPLKLKAVHHHPTRKNFKPFIEEKDKTIGGTGFLNEIMLKPGARILICHNLDTIDSLTNGQLGHFVDAVKNREGKVVKLILKLDKPGAGSHNREQNPELTKKYPDCIFIARVSLQYSTTKKYSEGSSKATLIQFPIRLAYAITAHKVQGSSIAFPTTVAMDINSCFQSGQAYVMLSRVQSLDQVYIVDKLDERKIMMSQKAFDELRRLEEVSLNRNPSIWQKDQNNCLKIASVNCAGLKAHWDDIKMDNKLLKADLILLQETSLNHDDSTLYELSSHPLCFHVKKGNGKGVSIYSKKNYLLKKSYVSEGFQIAMISIEGINIINVYRSSSSPRNQLSDKLEDFLNHSHESIIFGDLNICGQSERNNSIGRLLSSYGYTQLVKEATQIKGRQIDHLYVKVQCEMEVADLERFSPYYTDHDSLLLSVNLQVTFFENLIL